jgi:hypothetical protein
MMAVEHRTETVIVIVAVMTILLLLCVAVVINVGAWYDTDSDLRLRSLGDRRRAVLATSGSLTTGQPGYPCSAATTPPTRGDRGGPERR